MFITGMVHTFACLNLGRLNYGIVASNNNSNVEIDFRLPLISHILDTPSARMPTSLERGGGNLRPASPLPVRRKPNALPRENKLRNNSATRGEVLSQCLEGSSRTCCTFWFAPRSFGSK